MGLREYKMREWWEERKGGRKVHERKGKGKESNEGDGKKDCSLPYYFLPCSHHIIPERLRKMLSLVDNERER